MLQKTSYCADSSRVDSLVSFWIDSVSSVVGMAAPLAFPKGIVDGGRRARARLKAGDGKTVRDLTRMLVIVSG